MTFVSDFADAMSGYAAASVTLSIGSLVVQGIGTPGAVNKKEKWAFKITVHNNGDFNMNNVTLHYSGLNGAMVAPLLAGPFSPGALTTAPIASVPAHGSATTVNYFFQAPSADSNGVVVDLVDVHVNGYDLDFEYLQNNITGHSNPPDTKLAREVFP